MAAATRDPRRSSRLGLLLIGAAAGYALAQWMDRNAITWNDLGRQLMSPPRTEGASGVAGRIAFARDEARRAMAERRRALEAQAGRALVPPDEGGTRRRSEAGAGASSV